MEFDLYIITEEGMKVNLDKPQLLPEEKWVLNALKEQPYTVFGILKYVKNKYEVDTTHYKIKNTITMLKAQGFVEIRND